MTGIVIPFRTNQIRRFISVSRAPDNWAVDIIPPIDHSYTEERFERSGEAVQCALSLALKFGFPIRSEAIEASEWDRLVIEARKAR